MFCGNCGRYIGEEHFCRYCMDFSYEQSVQVSSKSRLVAGFLQIFTGALGLGRFYMGDKKKGKKQIIFSVLTLGVGGVIWGLIDGFKILSGKCAFDGYGYYMAE